MDYDLPPTDPYAPILEPYKGPRMYATNVQQIYRMLLDQRSKIEDIASEMRTVKIFLREISEALRKLGVIDTF